MEDIEIKEEFKKIWDKIHDLEQKKKPDNILEEKKEEKKAYKGLAGGIRMLIDEGFMDSPKLVKEIHEELKRQGFHYPQPSLSKLLSINFMKNKRILTRISEGKNWKYVIRK